MQNKQYDNNFNNVIMKKINYLAMLLAAGMFAACSDTLEDATGGNNTNTPTTGEGYVKVAINMPTTSGTSTRSTDGTEDSPVVDLEDGEANEYNVENAIIAFFKATTSNLTGSSAEDQATFVKAYAFTKADLSVAGSTEIPQVTEQVTTITEAPKVASTEQLYALAILNYNSEIVSVDNSNGNDGVLKIGTTSLTAGTSKLADLQKKISVTLDQSTNKTNDPFLYKFTGGSSTETRNQFTMTNAPLSSAAGTSSTISSAKAYTLVPVTVYDDKAAAEAGDVATIYVERVVAKVTLKIADSKAVTGNAKQIEVTGADGQKTDDIVEVTGWYLNVTNNSTKLVRDVAGFKTTGGWLATGTDYKPERFAGTRGINASFGVQSEGDYYRIYWAQDCNYVGTGTTDVTNVTTDFTTYHHENGSITPQDPAWNANLATATADNACYCLENTMDYSQQIENRTTGVLIKTKYYTKFKGEDEASAKNFFVCGSNATKHPEKAVGSGENSTKAFVDFVIEEANKLIDGEDNDLSTTDTKGLSLKANLASGVYTDVTDVFTFSETNTSSDKYKAQLAAVQAVVGGRISYYGGNGESYYYSSIIRHFQDGEGVSVSEAGVSDATAYTLQHLGRYGVVRNNWYEISINSVGGPGTPTIEEPGEEPDDSSEGYMRCAINVLSWAKRSQSVDL